ncbi:hypothetical protein BgiBS90_036636, partial [Biomphalaria glabrata]
LYLLFTSVQSTTLATDPVTGLKIVAAAELCSNETVGLHPAPGTHYSSPPADSVSTSHTSLISAAADTKLSNYPNVTQTTWFSNL